VTSRVLVATRNPGKLRELHGILATAGLAGITLDEAGIPESADEDTLECHDTFEENALAKARWFARISGMPTIADDSGLCVNALGGAPGVWSKRFSGRIDLTGQALDDANNAKLQAELRDHADRSAKYVCAAAYADGTVDLVALGETPGEIVESPSGGNGFGYDPWFLSSELGVTFGDATTEAKEVVSHRGRAFRALVGALRGRTGQV
jgi:XTP/dITP diphosphohydrolase